MNENFWIKARYFTFGLIFALGYSIIANGFLTKLIASADYEAQGFPFVIASDPYIATLIAILSIAMGVSSAMKIPSYTTYTYLKFNEYIQRLLDQMPEKERKKNPPSNVRRVRKRKPKSDEHSTVNPNENSYKLPDHWNNKE